jgi:hypothetical protein
MTTQTLRSLPLVRGAPFLHADWVRGARFEQNMRAARNYPLYRLASREIGKSFAEAQIRLRGVQAAKITA